MTSKIISVRVVQKRSEAQDICLLELKRIDGEPFPQFEPGSHIDVHLPNGLVRQYSLCNQPKLTDTYQICVLLDPNTRGGSQAVHESVSQGDELRISEPRNLFHLVRGDHETILLAGGIGVTPLMAMAWHLQDKNSNYHLHYFTRSRERTAFHDMILTSSLRQNVSFWFDNDTTNHKPSVREILLGASAGAHMYACGPMGFLTHVKDICEQIRWPADHMHYEAFTAAPMSDGEAFSVQIRSSGVTIAVPENQTVIEALASKGISIPVSCEQGICGTCLTRVCDGVPDHRDQYLTDEERAKGDQFTPCCSRSRSPVLVLDL